MKKTLRIKISLKTLLLILGMALVFSACSNNSSSNESYEPVAEKHLNFALFLTGNSLDHAEGYEGWSLTRFGTGETLVRLNTNMEVEPWLAESWQLIDDNTWVFNIREGVTFSNGKPLNAAAAMISIQRAFKMNNRALGYFKLKEMHADGQMLTIITEEPCSALLNNLVEPLFCIMDDTDETAIANRTPIGTGPYAIKEYNYEKQVVSLVKNDFYWAGEPGFDTVTINRVSDSEARVMAMQNGEADITTTIDNTSLALFENNDDFVVLVESGLRTNVVFMNNASRFLADATLRRAISMAVDRVTYAKLIGGKPATGLYSDALPFGNEHLSSYSLDISGANKLLDGVGYLDTDDDGIREINGENIVLAYYQSADHGSSDAAILAQAVQSDLKKVGIAVKILSTENLSDIIATGNFDMCSNNNNTAPTGDPAYFLSLTYATGGSANTAKYSNKAVDSILVEMLADFDATHRQYLAQQAAQQILDDAASLYLTYVPSTVVHSARVKNVVCHPVDYYCITWDMTVED